MTDISNDLAALRIPQEERGGGRGKTGLAITIVVVLLEEGHPVRAGQVLAHLDDSQARAGLGFAEAQLASARKAAAEDEAKLRQAELTLERRQQLVKENVV